jgi:ribonuclease Z
MKRIPGFRYIKPIFFAGLFDDPLLLVEMRPLGRSLLFDCGRIHHLAKRVLKSIDAIFISHAHMDHFMGIDTFIRSAHVSPKTFTIFGPPGLAAKLFAKLNGYDWNLAEPYWCSFLVHEIHHDKIESFLFPGSEGFPCRETGSKPRQGPTIYRNRFITVDADILDHRIPVLSFRINERHGFTVDEEKIAAEGLVKGAWLGEMERRFAQGWQGTEPLNVVRRSDDGPVSESVESPAALYGRIRKDMEPAAVGYLTDMGFTTDNLERAAALFSGVSLMVCECSFLSGDRDKARESFHLCTDDLNVIMERVKPKFLLPMHLSKGYIHESHLLYGELTPPSGVTVLRIPELVTPRPLIPSEIEPPKICR